MCTLTHFAPSPGIVLNTSIDPAPAMFLAHAFHPQSLRMPRFQVVLAGNAFFHIKEISTGHVRGFRSDHNEACALARALESRMLTHSSRSSL